MQEKFVDGTPLREVGDRAAQGVDARGDPRDAHPAPRNQRVHVALPLAATIPLSVLGAMWTLTGVLSKCSIYYALGFSTCPVSGAPRPSLRGNR